jgi:hypothetical protein
VKAHEQLRTAAKPPVLIAAGRLIRKGMPFIPIIGVACVPTKIGSSRK